MAAHPGGSEGAAPSQRSPDPRAYTPKHLADEILTSRAALEGERKQVTVLFADVKGSMELAEQVDAEEWHKILDRFFQILADGVHRFEGTVNQYTGDGIMALFGAPIAHEDHAQRACYAALHLRDELRRYADEMRVERGLNFSVRMGLNSGEVIVGTIGDDLRMDYTAQGHTVGLASRMEQLAESGKVLLTEHTAKLVSGYLALRDLGRSRVKGVSDPLGIFELEGVGPLRTRLDVSRTRGFSRFVGRANEMAMLEGALERAHAGQGQVIGVVAEPGTGKSRLCYEFVQRCRSRGIDVYEAHAVPHGKVVPLLLTLELTRAYLGISEQDSDRIARDKAAGRLLQMGEAFREALPLLFDFLGIADPAQPAPTMDPEERERRLFAITRQMYQMQSQRQTTVNLFEDLHWMDAGSEAFMTNTAHMVGGLRMLMLVTFRPEYHAEWMQKSFYQRLAILPLGREATDELLDDLLGSDGALTELRMLIDARSGGNPFFVEEIVQSLVEDGSLVGRRGAYRLLRPIQSLRVSASVQSLLAARVDRLGEREKRVLQTAAVIGKEFSEPVLHRVLAEQAEGSSAGEAHALAALRALVDAEFIHEQALYPVAEYAFKHPLTQEVAYQSQLADRRAQVHRAAAAALQALHPEKLDERAALLAYHCEAAGDVLRAAQWHRRAAQWVVKNSQAEALRHWRTVRALLATAPESPDAVALSLEACGALLNLLWRFGAPEEEAAALFHDGVALAERTGNASALVVLHSVYGAYALMRGNVAVHVSQHERAVALAERTGDPLLLLGALAGQIGVLPVCGRLDEALQVADRALSLPPELGPTFWGLDSRIFVLCMRALTLAQLGRLEESRQQFDLGMRIARDRGDLEPLGWLHSYYLDLAWFAGDAAAAHSHARHVVEIADKIGVPGAVAIANKSLGTAHLMNRDWPAATRALERAIAIGRERGHWQQDEPGWLAYLAEAYLGAGRQDEAERTASEALALAQARGLKLHELRAWYALACVARPTDAARARDALAHAAALAEHIHASAYVPLIQVERAELARLLGDEAAYQRELREAQRLFVEMGATGHAERVAAMLTDAEGST